MLFNSIEFFVFLPTVFLLYWFVFNKLKWQNMLVVTASYIFYGWWNQTFLLLIAFTTLCSYLSGIAIERSRNRDNNKTSWGGIDLDWWIAAANILANLLILGVYKYFNFFADSFVIACEALGFHPDHFTLHLVLPVGISFYTFQALSYTIDVYKHKIEPTRDIIAFFAFISFFPQLVAGPIERATNLLPQFLRQRSFCYTNAVDGLRQILWGLFKKMVVADNCAPFVNQIFENYESYNGFTLFVGGLLFTFQIYGDFSGYSDIAIGSAKLFGIELMRNFNVPYFSRDIAEFWRRWHISLTTWFRDYIYIPLGGSRCSRLKVMRNTLIIFLISGLWHGANWTFIIWGAYHALLFFPLMLLGKNRKHTGLVADGRWLPTYREILQIGGTFLFVVIGWIIFRSENIFEATNYITRMCTHVLIEKPFCLHVLKFPLLMLAIEWVQRDKQHALQIKEGSWLSYHGILRWTIYIALFILTIGNMGENEQFIYFQF